MYYIKIKKENLISYTIRREFHLKLLNNLFEINEKNEIF